jgi:hypothetical protein
MGTLTVAAIPMAEHTRRFAPPWTVEQTPGGYKVLDANGQSLPYPDTPSSSGYPPVR